MPALRLDSDAELRPGPESGPESPHFYGDGEVVPIAARRTPRQKRTRVRTLTRAHPHAHRELMVYPCSRLHHVQAVGADGLETWHEEIDDSGDHQSALSSQQRPPSDQRGASATHSSSPEASPPGAKTSEQGKRRKLSKRVSRRMLVEENGGRPGDDRLIGRAKDPPYDFALVPECRPELRDSVVIRVSSRRMCTFSIGEMFHLCNEAARRRAVAGLRQRSDGVCNADTGVSSSTFSGAQSGLVRRASHTPETEAFATGEVVECPSCLQDMKAPMRARALRCANCRFEMYPKHRLVKSRRSYHLPGGATERTNKAGVVSSAANGTEQRASDRAAGQPAAGDRGSSHMTKYATKSSRLSAYDKPLSLDYIADRLDIDNPLRGYMIRHKTGGWLQGFILVTTFTTWQRWFRWDSLAGEAGLTDAHNAAELNAWDHDGKLTARMESLPRSGDPEKEGVIWGRIAELSLLGGLKCGRFLLQLAVEEMEASDEYDFLVLQATDTSRSFYEGLGFIRVGAGAKVSS